MTALRGSWRSVFGLWLLAVVAGGCGSSSGGPASEPDVADMSFGLPDHGGGSDAGNPEDTPVAPPEVEPGDGGSGIKPDALECNREIMVLAEDPEEIRLTVDGRRNLTFRVIDYAAGMPAAGLYVRAELACDPGLETNLSALSAATSLEGLATLQVFAGAVGPGHCTLTLTAPCAADVVLDVSIQDLPRGSLKVEFLYDGAVPLNNIRVGVIPGNYQCGQFYAPTPPDDFAVQQAVAPSVLSDLRFQDLPVGNYALYATARGPTDHLAGKGCQAGVIVFEGEQTTVQLSLELLALRTTGTYDMVSVFDFTGAIPGQAGEIINWLVNLFYDPGQFLLDLVVEIIDIYLGQLVGGVAEWILDWFADDLADLVNEWIFNGSPEWLQDFFTMGQDILQIVKKVELLANLRLSKLVSDFSVQGVEEWIGLALYWHLNCLPEDDPNYNPDDCRWAITLEDLSQDPNFPMDLVAGHFTASVANFDDFIVERHSIELNYGRLILYVLNWAITYFSGGQYTSLLELIQGLVNCQAVGEGLVGDLLSSLGVDRDDVTAFCESAIVFLVAPAVSVLQGLAADSRLRLRGSATLLDENDDLEVDLITDGEFTGSVEVEGMAGSEFSAVWHATRQGYTPAAAP